MKVTKSHYFCDSCNRRFNIGDTVYRVSPCARYTVQGNEDEQELEVEATTILAGVFSQYRDYCFSCLIDISEVVRRHELAK